MKTTSLAGFAAAALLLGASAASAAPLTPTIGAYSQGIKSGSGPDGITAGPDGNLYFAEYNGGAIGILSPASGVTTEVPLGGASPHGQDLVSADGKVWFTDPGNDAVGSVTTGATHTVTEYTTGMPAGAGPHDITLGPDGNLWFTENNANKIGELSPANPSAGITNYPSTALTGAGLYGIIPGPGGKLWFAERSGNALGVLDPAHPSNAPTIFSSGITASSEPREIAQGPDGNVWFTEQTGDAIGVMSPSGTVLHQYPLPTASAEPTGLIVGPDGALWFAENHGGPTHGGAIGRITTDGTITEYPLNPETDNPGPFYLTVGPDGNIWFDEIDIASIGRITTPPIVTGAAGRASGQTAVLSGSLNPHAQITTYHFDYGTTTAYGGSTPEVLAGSGAATTSVSAALSGLLPNKTYHYRLVATNGTGSVTGPDGTFTTGAAPALPKPSAVTGIASSKTSTSAHIIGAVAPAGGTTTWWFEYGTSKHYGHKTGRHNAGSKGVSVVQVTLKGLKPGTRYHVRLDASSAGGTTDGADVTFTTPRARKHKK